MVAFDGYTLEEFTPDYKHFAVNVGSVQGKIKKQFLLEAPVQIGSIVVDSDAPRYDVTLLRLVIDGVPFCRVVLGNKHKRELVTTLAESSIVIEFWKTSVSSIKELQGMDYDDYVTRCMRTRNDPYVAAEEKFMSIEYRFLEKAEIDTIFGPL